MEIFEVRLSAASEDKLSELARCLAESLADLGIDGRLETVPPLGLIVYRCAGSAPDDGLRLAIHRRAAEGMAEYVLNAVEPELIRIMIQRYYPCDEDDAERIAELCERMLGGRPDRRDGGPAGGDSTADACAGTGRNEDGPHPAAGGDGTEAPAAGASPVHAEGGGTGGTEAAPEGGGAVRISECPGRERRKRHIAEELLAYLQERPSLHLEGYITFRLDKYWEELAETTEAAVGEFVSDRQYREFVGLLNEFVCRQQPRVPGVHLVLKADGGFALYDEAFRPMEPAGSGMIAPEFAGILDEDLNVEDMVVSCLLAISPREITLHARDSELPVVRTIGAIFAGRVTLCAGCRSCRPLTGAVPN
ncbi:MAG: hypothetical protein A9Z00_07685 [Thermobacillus sp. ZCTH02-B1]|uniref:putative sporulation protein YtxC n=1 Tax=Thermobacillus sp. ZCTH02-B1 TaxID=1858795 RepID=UPI000B5778F3|nr:putative sporulation protein YtxC [Thermobacillus sp. ZCTH02-B1]OUM96197.1 MAG: hypothetical protein A9Z00_07685 [Thermobacillus sp. ZCTH02-B1]